MRIEPVVNNIEIKIEPPPSKPEEPTAQPILTTQTNDNPQETYQNINGYDNSGFLRRELENQIPMPPPTIEPPTVTASGPIISTNSIETAVVAADPVLTDEIPAAQGLEFAITKGASELAYWAQKGEIYEFADGSRWQVAQVHHDSANDFRAILLKPLDPADDRTILSFAGTNPHDLRDLATDFQQWGGMQIPAQYLSAAHLAGLYQDQFGDNLILTGHSLGGGLAAFASMQNGGIATTTINPSTINGVSLIAALFPNPGLESNITNYVTPLDPISRYLPGITLGNDIPVEGGSESDNIFVRSIEDHTNVEPDIKAPFKIN